MSPPGPSSPTPADLWRAAIRRCHTGATLRSSTTTQWRRRRGPNAGNMPCSDSVAVSVIFFHLPRYWTHCHAERTLMLHWRTSSSTVWSHVHLGIPVRRCHSPHSSVICHSSREVKLLDALTLLSSFLFDLAMDEVTVPLSITFCCCLWVSLEKRYCRCKHSPKKAQWMFTNFRNLLKVH